MNTIDVKRLNRILEPSQERVLIRPFIPDSEERRYRIIARIMTLSDKEVTERLSEVMADFNKRHHDIEGVLLDHFSMVKQWCITDATMSRERQVLTGAYFTQEYSLESAALFNPSIVPHPDQSGLSEGEERFIMSLRATGEGHISSIVFREGVVSWDADIRLKGAARFVTEPERKTVQVYEKELFIKKLAELDIENDFSSMVMDALLDQFTLSDLNKQLEHFKRKLPSSGEIEHTVRSILTLAYSNYEVSFDPSAETSEKAIFPFTPSQSNGLEDARFVPFDDDQEGRKYYGTYTAFDGKTILPQILETEDFISFKFITLNGPGVKNKGMALFPRKIDGNYAMLSRQDNENIYLMYSDNIHFWYEPQKIVRPTYSWEFVQMGNCGSPIETDQGWIVLSHGVGPMRRYCIGAFLLDLDDPSRVIGRLRHPLIEPDENEREGYVPNVVYTCGALKHGERLIIPYAMSDYATGFAVAEVNDILDAME